MKKFFSFLLMFFFLVGPGRPAYATQHDYVISNDTGANVRSDINNALLSAVSNNSGLTAPSTTYAFQIWMDTTTGLLKIRNAANSAWITMGDPALTNLGLMPKTGGAFSAEVTFSNTDDIRIPQGTTAQRNGSPANGMIRYNTDLKTFEGYHESQFSSFQRELASPDYLSNLSLTASVGSNALTISLKTAAAAAPAAGDPVITAFRSATLASGDLTLVKTTGALTTVISSGSTAGHTSAVAGPLYIYLLNNAGTAELAWSTSVFDESVLVSTTAEGGAGAADSAAVMYSTTARSNVGFRMIGKMLSTQTTAGTWAAVPTQITAGTYGKLTQNSGQLKFPAIQNPSTDANTFDDYEEGTFTPAVTGTGVAGAGTYVSQVGSYTKTGNLVTFQVYMTWSAHTGTGNLTLTGLPFSSANVGSQYHNFPVYMANYTITAGAVVQCYLAPNSATVNFTYQPSGGGVDTAVPIDTAASLMITGSYRTTN